jgi:hypothetical protein
MTIASSARAFGCHDVVTLETPTPRHVDYLDLLRTPANSGIHVDAIAEFQSRPLLYLVSGSSGTNAGPNEILELQQLLANRGERAYLGILRPGELVVYPVNLDRQALEDGETRTIKRSTAGASQVFQSIVDGSFTLRGQPDKPDYVFSAIHELMTRSSERLIGTYGLYSLDVLSFLGRALFFRFIWDRGIVLPRELDEVCPGAQAPSDCFRNGKNTIATCRWLDETFNGDLLPLSGARHDIIMQAGRETDGEVYRHLQAIVAGWEHVDHGAFQLQLSIDWEDFEFSHIPIGVLSQVYEDFSRTWDRQQAEATSVYYTPRNIARYLVDDAFEGVQNKRGALVLDPSCGAGIFLVLMFRKLVAARWAADGVRPGTKTIQSILYNQVRGFDVSESALRLAALSLYVTAIELTPSPRPPKSLKFPKPMKGKVLFNHRRESEQETEEFVLGSLRSDLPAEFNSCFDLVVGNPPWSRLRGNSDADKINNARFTEIAQQALVARGLPEVAKHYRNPDKNPDLPFIWASTQWAKPGSIIAMALPSRIFLKQTPNAVRAFGAILTGIEITGILNGSNLADTEVWPGMGQPFMLLFARNVVPRDDHYFNFVTPYSEQHLNMKGRLRIDYRSAQPVAVRDIAEKPWLLKTLGIGTALDVDVVEKLTHLSWPTVKEYWDGAGLASGLGYNGSPKQKQYRAGLMTGMPDFRRPSQGCFSVSAVDLPSFTNTTAHMPRKMEIYRSPLLIIPQAPSDGISSAKSWVMREPIVFNQSFYGFSAAGSPYGEALVALLHLITHSQLFAYTVLMTSARFAAERRTFLKQSIEEFPFPDVERLSKVKINRIKKLSSALEVARAKPWKEINDFISELYGLDQYDRQVMSDTLSVSAPFKQARDRANMPPSEAERQAFYAELERLIAPAFEVAGQGLNIAEMNGSDAGEICPWTLFRISIGGKSLGTGAPPLKSINHLFREANSTGCSRVIIHGEDQLLIGALGQYRYWTATRARLCALDILRNHLAAFSMEHE